MFGGVAAAGPDRLVYVTFDGSVLTLDVETGRVVDQFTFFPSAPRRLHVSACAVDADGSVLAADSESRRVRRFLPDGRPAGLYGACPNPGIRNQDQAGILDEPCGVVPLDDGILVCCGGADIVHGVQRFDRAGAHVSSIRRRGHPRRGWKRAQGAALVEGALWIAETEGHAIRIHDLDGHALSDVEPPPGLRRPFRLADDGYEGVLLLAAPEDEEERDAPGVARLTRDGECEGWAVAPGESPGQVSFPFDLAVLPDGRFVVADLPLGAPPDVRLQLFAADGRLLRVLMEDVVDCTAAQRAYFESVIARDDGSARTLYEQARVHHYYSGAGRAELEKARDLYVAALDRDSGNVLARVGLGSLLQGGLKELGGAEAEYRRAIAAGGDEADLLCRIAECRRERGDLDGAIGFLQEALRLARPPENFH
ncbi:MAG: hypothetical protein ACREID_05290, partial [Planctomycetota bacterium]